MANEAYASRFIIDMQAESYLFVCQSSLKFGRGESQIQPFAFNETFYLSIVGHHVLL